VQALFDHFDHGGRQPSETTAGRELIPLAEHIVTGKGAINHVAACRLRD
jgi:hypothetical protein